MVSYSQVEVRHLLKYTHSINPLFSKKSKQINITFDKYSFIDSINSFRKIIKIDIADRKSDLTGSANDFNISGALASINNLGFLGSVVAGGINSSKFYTFRNTNGNVIFERNKFDSLLLYSKKIIELIDRKLPTEQLSLTYFFKVDNLELSLEIEQELEGINVKDVNGNSMNPRVLTTQSKRVFLKIDESIYVLTDEEFKSLYNDTLLSIVSLW